MPSPAAVSEIRSEAKRGVRPSSSTGGILEHFSAIQKILSPIHCLFPTLARPYRWLEPMPPSRHSVSV
jgi:hypothetical protein